ncbi:MAG: hypothetical protein U0R19_25420 [Bryobacteraceae bacterium]
MRFLQVCLLGAGVIALAAGPAMGAIYTDRATWEAALASRQDISFNGLSTGFSLGPLGSGSDTVYLTPINAMWLQVVTNAYGNSCDVRCLLVETTSLNAGVLATLALASNTAVGFNIFTSNDTAKPVTIHIYNVGSVTPDYSTTISTVDKSSFTPVFFGYTGAAGIQQVEIIVAQPHDLHVDNFSFGVTGAEEPPPPTDTPEVPTLGYVGIGFLAVLLGSHRKRHLPGR